MGFLPVDCSIRKPIGRVLIAIILLTLWSTWCDNLMSGIYTFLTYFPVVMLIMLPTDYKKDLLQFITKWYAILLGLGLIVYLVTLVVHIPSFGRFVHPAYEPFDNYIFYIKTTWDNGIFTRFNAFFLEPGHQALVSTFLLLANSLQFKKNRYCIILLFGVIFSFSLAGYLLLFTGWLLMTIKNLKRAILIPVAFSGILLIAINLSPNNNVFNELIINRLEYDEQKGIKGNNRFTERTDYLYEKGQNRGLSLVGMNGYIDTQDIAGAGYKIYVIRLGWIGVLLAALFYLSVIPPRCNVRYITIFLIVIALCFIQRSYPGWYSWLLPYVLGIYINKKPDIGDYLSENSEIDLIGSD